MTRDVSLCVVRVESSYEGIKNTKDANGIALEKSLEAMSTIRGMRKICEITIETYLPSKAETDKEIPALMAEGGNTLEETSENIKDGTIHFISGNPFVETFQGIIHLFKEDELTDIDRAGKRSQTVCILAVPATMTCTDLLMFIAACHDDIKHVRIVRDVSPNQYMALITFRSSASVVEFYKSFNGIPFNSLEPEWCCHLVFVSRVEAIGEDRGGSIPPLSHTELPTCPVCLERMDESVDGILTILCNHAFHGSCLSKWGDTSCPVCRYIQTPEPSGGNHCFECKATESLWICLICGHVGCGRYLQGHAYQHYIDTHHCYSMQLGSNSVWDYVGDNFVHRILQNKSDGKLVEGTPEKPVEVKNKINAIQLEYTYLLTSQLESQKTYYEEMNRALKDKIEKMCEENERLNEVLSAVNHEKDIVDRKINCLATKLTSAQKELNEEKELNIAINTNQIEWKKKFIDLEKDFAEFKIQKGKELDDVKEQLRDVMFFLEAQKTLSNSEHRDEIMEGTIVIPEETKKPSRHRRHKRH